jgi:hypothetical protein
MGKLRNAFHLAFTQILITLGVCTLNNALKEEQFPYLDCIILKYPLYDSYTSVVQLCVLYIHFYGLSKC